CTGGTGEVAGKIYRRPESQPREGRGIREAARRKERGSRTPHASSSFLRAIGGVAAGGNRARRGGGADASPARVDRIDPARPDRRRHFRMGVLRMKRASLLIGALLLGDASAATIEIGPPDDFRTVMQNLHAGDTLILDAGTYTLSSYFELDLN